MRKEKVIGAILIKNKVREDLSQEASVERGGGHPKYSQIFWFLSTYLVGEYYPFTL